MDETKIYRVRVTYTGAEISYEGALIYTVPDHGNFDRHLGLALDYLKAVEGWQWRLVKDVPQVGISIATSVLSKEYMIITEPVVMGSDHRPCLKYGLADDPDDENEAVRK